MEFDGLAAAAAALLVNVIQPTATAVSLYRDVNDIALTPGLVSSRR